MTDVKARSRAERARETRKRMRGAAHELFVSQGYADTTMKQIAAGAGVAVQTVYYTFKTKGALLCEVIEVAGAGEDGPVPVMQRPWMRETMSAPSEQRIIALAVEHATGSTSGSPRCGPPSTQQPPQIRTSITTGAA